MQSHSPPPFCVASWCFDPLHRLPQAEVHGQDRTLEKLQNELEDDVGACALREAQIRQSRQHDRELLGAQLDELAKQQAEVEERRQAKRHDDMQNAQQKIVDLDLELDTVKSQLKEANEKNKELGDRITNADANITNIFATLEENRVEREDLRETTDSLKE